MPVNNPFLSVEEEARRAADELAAMKEAVKELLTRLTLVEKRLAAIAPAATGKATEKTTPALPQTTGGPEELFKGLLAIYKTSTAKAETELAKYKRDELAGLAKYAGCTVTSKSGKKDLATMVMGKLRESKIINTGIN